MNNNMNIIYAHSQLSPIQQCQAAVALRSFCDDSLTFDYSVSDIIYLARLVISPSIVVSTLIFLPNCS